MSGIMDLGIVGVAAITIICYLIGMCCKATGKIDKWIPAIVGVAGGILGVVAKYVGMPDFPAVDVITAIAVGIVSGLAATGINQIGKQLSQ